MNKVLKNIIISKKNISYTGENRLVKIIGTPGARFQLTLTNQADVSKLSKNARGYSSTFNLIDSLIPESGVYSFEQHFPAVTASAKYKIKVSKRFDTTFGKKFKDYILINQWYPTTLTLTLASAGSASDFDSHGSFNKLYSISKDGRELFKGTPEELQDYMYNNPLTEEQQESVDRQRDVLLTKYQDSENNKDLKEKIYWMKVTNLILKY